MRKIDAVVKRETVYIAAWVGVFSIVMQVVFLVIGKWDYTVLLGNLLSAVIGVLNFFLMGLTVQNAVAKEEKEAKNTMKLSQTLRFLLLLVSVILGVVLPCFHTWAVIIPLFFPRVAIAFHPLFAKRTKKGSPDPDEEEKGE